MVDPTPRVADPTPRVQLYKSISKSFNLTYFFNPLISSSNGAWALGNQSFQVYNHKPCLENIYSSWELTTGSHRDCLSGWVGSQLQPKVWMSESWGCSCSGLLAQHLHPDHPQDLLSQILAIKEKTCIWHGGAAVPCAGFSSKGKSWARARSTRHFLWYFWKYGKNIRVKNQTNLETHGSTTLRRITSRSLVLLFTTYSPSNKIHILKWKVMKRTFIR